MKAVKAGEYIGNDERTYRWVHEHLSDDSASGYDHQAKFDEWETEWIDPEDWPAAKAALDALIAEQDAEQWVEWFTDYWYRAKSDASQVQFRASREERWTDCRDGETEAYRKGREVAQAEHEALREQVRALVEAVLDAKGMVVNEFGPVPSGYRPPFGFSPVSCGWLNSVRDAAMRVQL